MRKTTRFATYAILLLTSLAVVPAPADAAWWPFSKKNERNNAAPPPETLPPTAAPSQPLEPVPQQSVVAEPVVAEPAAAAERLDRVEARIRELTGEIEQLAFQLRQLQDTLQQVQADNEYRFSALEGGSVQLDDGAVVLDDQPMDQIGPIIDSGGDRASSGTEEEPLGRLVIDAPPVANADQPIDLTPGGGTAAVPVLAAPGDAQTVRGGVEVASLGDAAADYERAYGNILSGDYAMAEVSFRDFLANFPADTRAPDAQYWLGESLFARGQYRDAADQFLSGYKSYPDSAKAPDTLLKLGLSLAGLGEREAACSTYAEVLRKYPEASNALRQRVAAEQAIASC